MTAAALAVHAFLRLEVQQRDDPSGVPRHNFRAARYPGEVSRALRHAPSQLWRTFSANHVGQIVAAADFFVVPSANCRLFVLCLLNSPTLLTLLKLRPTTG